MSFRIQYGISRHEVNSRKTKFKKWLPFLLAVIFLVAGWLISLTEIRFDWLLPGDPEVTAAALESLRENLAAGESLGEAVTAFCREIINGAALGE